MANKKLGKKRGKREEKRLGEKEKGNKLMVGENICLSKKSDPFGAFLM